MISAWWTLFAFIGGGYAGVLLIALMRVAAEAVPQSIDGRQVNSGDPSLNPGNPHANISK